MGCWFAPLPQSKKVPGSNVHWGFSVRTLNVIHLYVRGLWFLHAQFNKLYYKSIDVSKFPLDVRGFSLYWPGFDWQTFQDKTCIGIIWYIQWIDGSCAVSCHFYSCPFYIVNKLYNIVIVLSHVDHSKRFCTTCHFTHTHIDIPIDTSVADVGFSVFPRTP